MRPLAFANGNSLDPTVQIDRGVSASMRPLAFANGNSGSGIRRVHSLSGFNEAVGFRQREYGRHSAATFLPERFNEAVGFRQREWIARKAIAQPAHALQ